MLDTKSVCAVRETCKRLAGFMADTYVNKRLIRSHWPCAYARLVAGGKEEQELAEAMEESERTEQAQRKGRKVWGKRILTSRKKELEAAQQGRSSHNDDGKSDDREEEAITGDAAGEEPMEINWWSDGFRKVGIERRRWLDGVCEVQTYVVGGGNGEEAESGWWRHRDRYGLWLSERQDRMVCLAPSMLVDVRIHRGLAKIVGSIVSPPEGTFTKSHREQGTGRLVVATSGHNVYVRIRKRLHHYADVVHAGSISTLMSCDGVLCTGDAQGVIHLTDMSSGSVVRTFDEGEGTVHMASFSPAGLFATRKIDGISLMSIYDVRQKEWVFNAPVTDGARAFVTSEADPYALWVGTAEGSLVAMDTRMAGACLDLLRLPGATAASKMLTRGDILLVGDKSGRIHTVDTSESLSRSVTWEVYRREQRTKFRAIQLSESQQDLWVIDATGVVAKLDFSNQASASASASSSSERPIVAADSGADGSKDQDKDKVKGKGKGKGKGKKDKKKARGGQGRMFLDYVARVRTGADFDHDFALSMGAPAIAPSTGYPPNHTFLRYNTR